MCIRDSTKIIVATGNESREVALRAVQLGAYDFHNKPVDLEVLRLMIARAAKLHAIETENRRLEEMTARSAVDGIVASSPQMTRILRTVEKIAPTDVAVLLLGELSLIHI